MSRDIAISQIDPDPHQPREHFDLNALEGLAASMAEIGLAVPILVRPDGERFVIVHGERRWRAAGLIGWDAIPADVRDIDADTASWLALVENVQRSDLTPIEEAFAFKGRLDRGITQEELGRRIGKSQSYIAHKLRLLTLPSPLTSYLASNALSEGHLRTLLRIRNIYRGGESGNDPELDLPFNVPDDRLPGFLGVPDRAQANEKLVLDFTDRAIVVGFFAMIRPLEHPGPWVGVNPDHDISPALTAGCVDFIHWSVERRRVPAWVVTAFWWASAAVFERLSVATLALGIDRWRESLYGAVVGARFLRGGSGPPASPLENMEWWGWRADLRHAGLDPETLPGDLPLRVSEWLEAGNDLPLPTMVQPWGFAHERYRCFLGEGAPA
jgi:ParB/RepB/Spo0J family partition protein